MDHGHQMTMSKIQIELEHEHAMERQSDMKL